MGSGNSGYSNWGAGDKVKRQQEAGKYNERLLDAHNVKQARFDELAKGINRGPATYDQLMKLALQAGFDDYTAGRILYKYSPEANGGASSTSKKETMPVYANAADEYDQKAAYRFNNHTDPRIKAGIAADMVNNKPSYENYLRLAQSNYEARQYVAADKAYEKATSMQPENATLCYEGANTLAMMGDGAGAEAKYRQALAKGKTFPGIFTKMAWASFQQGHTADALQHAEKAAQEAPQDAGATLMQAALSPAGPPRDGHLEKAAQQGIPRGTLTAMLSSHAKKLQAANDFEQSIIFLDLAVAAEPANLDLVELRYGTNKKLGRNTQADADQKLLEQ